MYASQPGLAKRHNTLAFLMAIYLNAIVGGEDTGELAKTAMAALERLLGG